MKATTADRKTQVLEKTNIPCLYRSAASGIYYGIFTRGTEQVKKSLKTNDKELSRRRLESLRQKVSRLNTKAGREIMFVDMANRWLESVGGNLKPSSRLRRETAIHGLKPWFPKTVRSISGDDIESWAKSRAVQRSARTFNIERETLIKILDYAVSKGLILEHSARTVKRQKQRKAQIVIPTKAQFKTMVDQIRQADARATEAANLCEFLAYSGCRLAEATEMPWGDVNFELKNFTITGGERGTKNHEARTVPLFPALQSFLIAMRSALPQPPKPTDRLFTIQTAKKAIATSCRKAALPHFTHHSLRHFFCSNAIEAGIDFKTIAGWLGHKDGGLLVAKTYGHLRDEHSAAMAKRMGWGVSTVEPDNVVPMAAGK